MFSTNKWVNLGIIAVTALVICLIVTHTTKVVDANGKATGNKLKAFAPDETKAAA